MTAAWPEPVERVSSFLRRAGGEARIHEFRDGTPTAEAAAEAAGCELGQIVKSLVFMCDERAVVALVPGDRRGDAAKVARAAQAERARVASAEEVRAATGFPPGGVAPFPLARVERVLMDRSLLRQPVVWAGAGTSRHLIALAPGELRRLTRARPMDVCKDATYDSAERAKES